LVKIADLVLRTVSLFLSQIAAVYSSKLYLYQE